MTKRSPLYFLLVMAVMLSSLSWLASCNKSDDDDDTYTFSTSTQTTLIKSFVLQNNSEVLADLDSVHFTIDYDNGLIYNADSLPVGTKISALKVSIEFLNSVSSAVFDISGATRQADTTIIYTSSMTKSIDFTGKTLLTVTSGDESQVKVYEVKVLVHKVNPDSLVWPQSWRRDLPGYAGGQQKHKAVMLGDTYFIMTYDGTNCNLLTAQSPNQAIWEKRTLSLSFVPDVKSLVASDAALYMLDADGMLYSSADGMEWTSCGVAWYSLLGAYQDRVLGVIRSDDGNYYHDEYPRHDGFAATAIEDGFPVSHASDMIMADNEWVQSLQSMIVGGIDRDGNVLSSVWGYDGNHWGQINNVHSTAMPALADATLFTYYTYKAQSGVRRYGRQLTWFVMGGKLADGNLNGTVYISNTQGVTWASGDTVIFQPSHMPRFYGAQAFVNDETLTVGPNYLPSRVASMITSWECPYLYLFGGYNGQNELLPNVWRGVYIRMTNTPVY